VISNREWITVFPILGLKLTLKVDTPDLIGFMAGSKLTDWYTSLESSSTGPNQSMTREDGTDGTDCWKDNIGILSFQGRFELFGSPTGMIEFGIQNHLLGQGIGFTRQMMRTSGLVFESIQTKGLKTMNILIGGFSRDSIFSTQICHLFLVEITID
jgi:hypothetical protein